MSEYPVIDSDGHIWESAPILREYLEPEWCRSALSFGDGFDRSLGGKLGHEPEGSEDQLAAMDQDGIDVMVLYPSLCLGIGQARDRGFGPALSRAYNNYLRDFCAANPERLKFVAVLAPQDVEPAAAEMRRAVNELGAIGAMLPGHVPARPDWGHYTWDPIYAEAERLDIPIAFHAMMRGTAGLERFDNFINVHTVGHSFEQIMALCGTIVGGVLERFPDLRLGYLEAGVGWVPYFLDRLDEEVEMRGAVEAPGLTMSPTDYVRNGRVFFGVECGEKTVPDGVRWGLEDTLLYSSDYPHWDGDWPHTVSTVNERSDLTDDVKRKFLYENAIQFYGDRVLTGRWAKATAAVQHS